MHQSTHFKTQQSKHFLRRGTLPSTIPMASPFSATSPHKSLYAPEPLSRRFSTKFTQPVTKRFKQHASFVRSPLYPLTRRCP